MERLVSRPGRQCLQWLLQHHSRSFASALSSFSPAVSVNPPLHSHAVAVPNLAKLNTALDRQHISSSWHQLSPQQQSVLASWAVRSFHTSSVVDVRKTGYSNFGHKRRPSSKWSYFYSAFLTTLFLFFFGFNGWVLAAESWTGLGFLLVGECSVLRLLEWVSAPCLT